MERNDRNGQNRAEASASHHFTGGLNSIFHTHIYIYIYHIYICIHVKQYFVYYVVIYVHTALTLCSCSWVPGVKSGTQGASKNAKRNEQLGRPW